MKASRAGGSLRTSTRRILDTENRMLIQTRGLGSSIQRRSSACSQYPPPPAVNQAWPPVVHAGRSRRAPPAADWAIWLRTLFIWTCGSQTQQSCAAQVSGSTAGRVRVGILHLGERNGVFRGKAERIGLLKQRAEHRPYECTLQIMFRTNPGTRNLLETIIVFGAERTVG